MKYHADVMLPTTIFQSLITSYFPSTWIGRHLPVIPLLLIPTRNKISFHSRMLHHNFNLIYFYQLPCANSQRVSLISSWVFSHIERYNNLFCISHKHARIWLPCSQNTLNLDCNTNCDMHPTVIQSYIFGILQLERCYYKVNVCTRFSRSVPQ